MANRHRSPGRTGFFVLMALPLLPLLAIGLAINDCVTSRRRTRKLRDLAETAACPFCGKIFGAEAMALAQKEHHRRVQTLMTDHPDTRFRLISGPDLLCPACETEFSWMKDGTLEPYPWGRRGDQPAET